METATTASVATLQKQEETLGRHRSITPVAHQLFSINYTRPTYGSAVQVSYFWSSRLVMAGAAKLAHVWNEWPSPIVTDTFDRYDVTIGGITWHVKDGYFLKSLNAKQLNWHF
ncbi:MAG: hypothetical protein WBD81_20160, partial [Collimonas pratensis]|uniref:hypothetical protein n=1 Tax=Collimonas pratensis TaxID=279113 RepID=UPI003C716BE8